MNHPVIDTRLDTCQSPARAPCTAQPSTSISQGFCCPNLNHAGGYKVQGACCIYISVFLTLEKQVLGLQTVAGGGADGGDTWHVTRGCRPDTASSSAAGGGTWQLEEARDSWWRHVTAGSWWRHVTTGGGRLQLVALGGTWQLAAGGGTWHATRVSRQTQQLVRGPQLGAVGLMRLLGRAFLFSRFHQLNQSERRKQSAWLHYLTTRKIIPNLPREIINMYLKYEWVFYTIHWDI